MIANTCPQPAAKGTSEDGVCVSGVGGCERKTQGAQKQMQRRGRLVAGMPDHTENL